jgi:AhpC/TSA family
MSQAPQSQVYLHRVYCNKSESIAYAVKSHVPVQRESATPKRMAMNACASYITHPLSNETYASSHASRGDPSSPLLEIPYLPWYTCGMAATPSIMFPLGIAAPPFALPDVVSGATISLQTFADKKSLLVMFLCRHCKYVQHVKLALTTLGKEYQGTDLDIVAISATAHLFSTKTMFTLDFRRCDPSFPAFLPGFRSLREA